MWFTLLFNYRKQLAIALVVLILVLIAYYAYHKFMDPKAEAVPLPNDDPNGVLSESEAASSRNLAVLLHDDMQGWFDSRDNELYQTYAQFSDKLFVAVYNEFNALYFSEGYGSLKSWFKDETYTVFTGNLVRNTILPRMDKLGLV